MIKIQRTAKIKYICTYKKKKKKNLHLNLA